MARTGAPTPAGLGQLRWRRAFKSRSKQVRSDRAQPPPGGPSGKLERDSVCRRPWGGSGGGEGRAITHAPSPALPARTRGGGGGGAGPSADPGLQAAPAAQKEGTRRLARRRPSPQTRLRPPRVQGPKQGAATKTCRPRAQVFPDESLRTPDSRVPPCPPSDSRRRKTN